MAKSGDATKAEKMTENNKANEDSENIDTKVRRIIEDASITRWKRTSWVKPTSSRT